MEKEIKHISKEKIEAAQNKLEEMLRKDPLGREFLEEIAKIEKIIKEKQKGR